MTNLKCCTFLLFLLSSYVVCESIKLVGKTLNLSKERDFEHQTPKQQALHAESPAVAASAAAIKDSTRQKRSQSEFNSNEYKDLNELIGDLEDNTLATALEPNAAIENMSPLIYHLILQKLKQLQANEQAYRVLTPRLGRSIDLKNLDLTFGLGNDGVDSSSDVGANRLRQQKQFVSHLIKKSVPFKPRLGKRTRKSMLCD